MRRGPLTRVMGEHPVGTAFVTPYVVFLAAVFAYPLGFAVYMSFHDYFFAAPGAVVDRPFVGFENYVTVLTDPAVQRSFVNVVIFLVINVPLVPWSHGSRGALNSGSSTPFRYHRSSHSKPSFIPV